MILNASRIFIQQYGRDILCVQTFLLCKILGCRFWVLGRVFSFALLSHSWIHWCGVSGRLVRI